MKSEYDDQEEIKERISPCSKRLYILTEASLIIGAIPALVLFLLAWVTSLIMLIEQDEYDKCVVRKKLAKVVAGGNADDVSDRLELSLIGSAVGSYIFITLYGQILFSAFPIVYKFSGLIIMVAVFLIFGFNIVATIWLIENDCDDTAYYYTAIANNGILYIITILVAVATLLVYWWASGRSSNDSAKIATESKKDGKPTELPSSKGEDRKEKWEDKKEEGKHP